MPFYGDFEPPLFKEMVRVARDDRVYFIESDRSIWLGGGDLSFVSRRRPLHTHHVLSSSKDGIFHSPCPLPDGKLLVSYRTELPGSSFSIYRISPETGKLLSEVYKEDGWHSVDAHALTPHPRVEGRSTWVNYNIKSGVFYCLDAYMTDRPEGKKIPPGSIKRLRVIEGLPIHQETQSNQSSGRRFGLKRILGLLPMEEDGSFHIKVPANTPISFQLLDENNMALQTQQSWIWVMPNESRGCIGCHENEEMSPPNRLADAVIKPSVNLTLPPEQRRSVDFRHEIGPIIQRKCSAHECHSSDGVIPNLDMTPLSRQVYDTLLSDGRYINPGNAKESPLIWLFFGKRMGSPETPYTGTMSSIHSQNLLTTNERIQFIEWIDLFPELIDASVCIIS